MQFTTGNGLYEALTVPRDGEPFGKPFRRYMEVSAYQLNYALVHQPEFTGDYTAYRYALGVWQREHLVKTNQFVFDPYPYGEEDENGVYQIGFISMLDRQYARWRLFPSNIHTYQDVIDACGRDFCLATGIPFEGEQLPLLRT